MHLISSSINCTVLCLRYKDTDFVATCRHGIALNPFGKETIVDASMTIKNSAVIGASDNPGA